MKFYRCAHCGNIVAYIHDSGVRAVCCGEEMKELVPNTTDAAGEKHVPVIAVDGQTVTVTVGSVEHPMLDHARNEAGPPAQSAQARREARRRIRPRSRRRGDRGLRVLQSPRAVEGLINTAKQRTRPPAKARGRFVFRGGGRLTSKRYPLFTLGRVRSRTACGGNRKSQSRSWGFRAPTSF